MRDVLIPRSRSLDNVEGTAIVNIKGVIELGEGRVSLAEESGGPLGDLHPGR